MHSTPEKPPPATTKVSSRRRTSGSVSVSASSSVADELVAQVERVAEIFERARVLAHARDLGIVELRAHRDDQVFVGQRERVRLGAGTERHGARVRVDRLHIPRVKIGLRRHAADGRDDVIQLHGAGDYFRQQRLEGDVVFLADEDDFDLLELSRRQQFAEMDSDINAAKTAAENKDALFCHGSGGCGENQ